jgi:alpha-L-rhamnosidase
MKRFLLFLALLPKVLFAQTPINLKTEYDTNPVGLDVNPRFSWQIESKTRATKQTGYQVLVASSEKLLNEGKGDLWAPPKVTSDQQLFIEYKGKPLVSRQRIYWKVKIWNEKAKNSPWSANAYAEMALLQRSDWSAQWIGLNGTQGKPAKPVDFQKEFTLSKRATRIRVYATGLGMYHMVLNGRKVGTQLLTPGWTHYPKSLQYQTFEIDPETVSPGLNFISGSVGSGWWNAGLGWERNAWYSQGPNRLFAQLEFTFYDGSIQTIATDNTWEMRPSATLESNLYDGEKHEGLKEYEKTWVKANIMDETPSPTELFMPDPATKKQLHSIAFSTKDLTLKAAPIAGIEVSEDRKPISITEPKRGVYVFDFGQNLVGTTQLNVKGKPNKDVAGKKVELKFAELLDKKGLADQANLRKIRPTDTYYMKGYGLEEWTPKFTYHGFRYIEASGLPMKPTDSTLIAKVMHNKMERSGNFECSNTLLNKIYENTLWSQRGNTMSVPTDCPQRDERLGWMGDAQIFAPTAMYNYNTHSFFAKWQQDIAESQETDGSVHDVNPQMVIPDAAKPGWGDAVVIMPYQMYKFYGDKGILAQHYNSMKAWVDYMNNHPSTKKNGIYHYESLLNDKPFYGYGDWVPAEASPTKPIGGAYQHYCNKLMEEIAGILAKPADQKYFKETAIAVATAYQKTYFNTDKKQYEGATQAANLIPYNLGITPADLKPIIAKNVIDNVVAKNNHLSTGFLATQMLLPTLSNNGAHELAYQVATQKTYPSWGYMVEKGATTIWELWNSDTEKPEGMNSRNHFAYGSVVEWYYAYLAGIQQDASSNGFKKIRIAPQPASDLTWVKASYQCAYGKIVSNWEKTGKTFKLSLEIPAGTTAEIQLPTFGNSKAIIKESGKPTKPTKIGNENAIIAVGSGSYVFEVNF